MTYEKEQYWFKYLNHIWIQVHRVPETFTFHCISNFQKSWDAGNPSEESEKSIVFSQHYSLSLDNIVLFNGILLWMDECYKWKSSLHWLRGGTSSLKIAVSKKLLMWEFTV